MRAISFIIRDKDWGTYNPTISDPTIEQDDEHFAVHYQAIAEDSAQRFAFEVEIKGASSGQLTFSGKGEALSDFLTNRTGFVVLHPINGVAGARAEIEHTDGRVVDTRFPSIIDPVQPMMDLRRITHFAANGALRVDCLMEGDTYEMEDQRNWTDASYKTYVRPLALPWPYTIAKGERIDQAVTLTVTGDVAEDRGDAPILLTLGDNVGKVPYLGMGIDPDDCSNALEKANEIASLNAHHLICHYDPRRGHSIDSLRQQIDLAKRSNMLPWLEAVVTTVEGFEEEILELGQMAEQLGSPFGTVLVSPAPDMKCTLPGSVWPDAPDADRMYHATRKAFPKAVVGGGMFSYFTELNRKRPPLDNLDLVSFTTSALVHAGDDRSVTETLQALPAIALSVKSIAKHLPFAVGPSAIGMRDNPYGAAAKENSENIRQAMNRNDPRQRGQLGAAWALGYFARFAYGGASHIAIGSPVGATGAVYAKSNFPQPYFDDEGGYYPCFHVLKMLANAKGADLRAIESTGSDRVEAFAFESADEIEVIVANSTAVTQSVSLGDNAFKVARLSADNFVEATRNVTLLDQFSQHDSGPVQLVPYEIVRVRVPKQ